jgi:hypothetical protein
MKRSKLKQQKPTTSKRECRMPTPKDDLKERLARYRQIKISVIGRKSGQTISIPV